MPPDLLPRPLMASLPSVVSLEGMFPDMASMVDPFAPQMAQSPRPRYQSIQMDPGRMSRLLTQLREHYEEAREGRDESEWRRALRYRRYMTDPTLRDGMQPWTDAPQVFTSMTRKTIERIVDEQMGVLLPDYERICVKGIGEEDAKGGTKKQQFLRWVLERLNKFRATLKDGVMDAALDGLGILKVYPRRTSFDGWLTPEALAQYGQSILLLQTIIEIEAVDQGGLLIPPDATGFQWPEARYMGQELWVHPIDDFPDMRQRGYALADLDMGDYEPDGETDIEERQRLALTRDGEEPASLHRGRVPMVEQYERFDVDGSGVRSFIVAHWFPEGTYGRLGGDGCLARVVLLKEAMPQTHIPRPMWPYFPLRLWRQRGQLRGMNVPDRIEWQQDVLNRLVEQMLQSGEIEMLPFFFYNAALTGSLPDLTQVRPGQGIPLDQGGTVTFKPASSHNQHYIEAMNMVKSFAEEDTNVTDTTQGRNATQPNAQRTASGLAMLLQQGNKTFSAQALDLAEQVQEPLELSFALWQSHMEPSLTIPMPDTEAIEARLLQGDASHDAPLVEVTFTAEEISGRFDLSLKINPEALLEQQKELTMAERLDVLLQDYPLGRRQLWKHVWEQLGLKEFDRFYPEEVARIQTMLRVLQADVALGQLEMQLMQLTMMGIQPPPESAAIMQPGGPGAPQPAPAGGNILGMLQGLLGQAGSAPFGGVPIMGQQAGGGGAKPLMGGAQPAAMAREAGQGAAMEGGA